MYHSLRLVFVQFYVKSPFRYSGDHSVISLSQMFAHEFYLFVFDGSTFGIGGNLLHVRTVVAEILIFCFGYASPSVHVLRYQTMYHHIRKTTDRRSKVGIIIECQTVVSDVVRRITRFLHGTDGYGFNEILFLLSVNIIQQMVDRL